MIATDDKLLTLLEPLPGQLREAEERFIALSPVAFDKATLRHLTDAGIITPVSISQGGITQYMIWFQLTQDRGMHVNCAVQIAAQPERDLLFAGVETIARNHGCKYVLFHTRRPGLMEAAKDYGYSAQSISMVKTL